MAALVESFSIREFAARKRSADAGKSWPFAGGLDGRLPPIQIRKFRWWMDEVEAARAHEMKKRKPKKRSIADLFAVAPQIEGSRRAKKKKMKKKNGILGTKGVKICKRKASADYSPLLQDLILRKRLQKTLMALSGKKMKKSKSTKNLRSKSNGKDIQTLKSASNKQAAVKVLHTRSILKKQTRATLAKKRSEINDTQGENLLESCRTLVKHVTFSGKDDILGHSSRLELPPLQTLRQIFSNVLDATTATKNLKKDDKHSHDTEETQLVNSNDKDIAEDTHNHETAFTMLSKRKCASFEETSVGKIVDLNSAVQLSTDLAHVNSGNMQTPISVCEKNVNASRIHESGSNSGTGITEKFPSSFETCVSRFDPGCSVNATRNITSHAPCFVTDITGKQSQLRVEPTLNYISCIADIRRKGKLSSNDIMSSICSSVGSNTYKELGCSSDSTPNHIDRSMTESFVGLPLNSKGELMKMCSRSKYDFRDLLKMQNTAMGSLHDFQEANIKANFPDLPICQKDQSTWFPEQHNFDSQHVGSGLCITGMKEVISRNQSVSQHPNLHYECLNHYQTHTLNDMDKLHGECNLDGTGNPQTMRLMGKNVTVCAISNGWHLFPETNTWKDNERTLHAKWPQQDCMAQSLQGAPKGITFQQLETPGTVHVSGIQSRTEQMPFHHCIPFDCQEQWMPNNQGFGNQTLESFRMGRGGEERSWDQIHGGPSNTGCYSQKHWPSHSALSPFSEMYCPSQAFHSANSKSLLNFFSATEPTDIDHQLPRVASHARDVYQHMLHNSNICDQNHSHNASSTLRTPFENQGNGPLSAPTSLNLHPWLLNQEARKQHQNNSYPYPDQIARHNMLPCWASTVNSPMHLRSAVASPNPGSLSSPSLVSPYPTNNGFSILNSSYRSKIMTNNATKSRYVEDQEKAEKSRKRHADIRDGFMRPAKKSNVSPIEIRREPQRQGLHNAESPMQLGSGSRRINVDYSKTSSLKHDCTFKLGPIKLGSGEKHILKPSNSTDKDNSRLVHSTIPFGLSRSSSKVPISREKSTKIYMF